MKNDDDFVLEMLARIQAAGVALTDDVALSLEREIRRDYGGASVYIGKSVKIEDKKALAMADLKNNVSIEQVSVKHGISRASLYRLLKRT